MKKYYEKLLIITILVLIILPVMMSNHEKEIVSEIDNRYLTEFPDERSNYDIFMNQLDLYLSDRIGFRNDMIKEYTLLNDRMFDVMEHPNYEYGKEGFVFSKVNRDLYDPSVMELFPDFLIRIKDYVESKGKEFLFIITPNKRAFFPEYLADGKKVETFATDVLVEELKKKNLDFINLVDELKTKENSSDFFNKKYDAGHWNERGAFEGVNAILTKISSLGFDISTNNVDDYILDYELMTSLPVSYFPIIEEVPIINHENYSTQYSNDNIDAFDISDQYRAFGQFYNENLENELSLLFYRGSYFNGKEKFLVPHFKESTVIHNYMNIFNLKKHMELVDPDIVLFEVVDYVFWNRYFDIKELLNIVENGF